MSRAAIALDRAAALVVAVILIAVGAGAVAWWLDLLTWLPAARDTSVVRDGTHQPWWPWAAGGAGLIAMVAGLRWMIAHLPDRGVGDLMLTGSGPDGALRAASGPVAHAAAQALAAAPGVRRGQRRPAHHRRSGRPGRRRPSRGPGARRPVLPGPAHRRQASSRSTQGHVNLTQSRPRRHRHLPTHPAPPTSKDTQQ